MVSRTEMSVTVKTEPGQEYALLLNNLPYTGWQTEGEFTNLNSNTEFTCVTRKCYDAQTTMESEVSEATNVKTLINFSGSGITNIYDGMICNTGSSLTASAVGNGMYTDTPPSINDSRWKPLRWICGDISGTWTDDSYELTIALQKAGKYILSVVFGVETYTSDGWQSMNIEKMLSISFTAIDAAAETPADGSDTTGISETAKSPDTAKTLRASKSSDNAKTFKTSASQDTPNTGNAAQSYALWTAAGLLSAAIILQIIGMKRRIRRY